MNADYVVVGAGSAGCVMASRLSEDGSKVVLLEAGPKDRHPMIHIPAGIRSLLDHPVLNWNYSSEPEENTGGRRIHWPRGKVLGRFQLDQRHALCPRQPGRLRWLGAARLPWLGLRQRSAVLHEVGNLSKRGRRRGAGPKRTLDRRGLPNDPAGLPISSLRPRNRLVSPSTRISMARARKALVIRR